MVIVVCIFMSVLRDVSEMINCVYNVDTFIYIIKAITGFKFKQHQIQIVFMQLNTNHYIIL